MCSSFQIYYIARILESLKDENKLLPVFASSNIKIYPFQIAAADFALRYSYQKGVILCDESGMGKSHEAMLVIVQKWYEGKKILLLIPNAELLKQWIEIIENYYSIPYSVIKDKEQWNEKCSENKNPFEDDRFMITTYDFAVEYSDYIKQAKWDITVFEEATALSSVYLENSTQIKKLNEIADATFKILLTGTPIEKNIMDLYGLVYFIDKEILPDVQTFLRRYLRRPENYPELSESISYYCFRTLRSQAKQYAKITNRVFITQEYESSENEQKLYDMLYSYCNKPKKIAFPEMNQYDLTLKLLDLQGSSTSAILQTITKIIKRLKNIENSAQELEELNQMKKIAENIAIDNKTKFLIKAMEKIFQVLKKLKANRKVVIFTFSVATQKYLYNVLKNKYKTVIYNGSADYSVIEEFKTSGEILISTDHGARGFNLIESAFVIHYDLLYNTLKMEQRIDRCQRLEQENDVISLAFIDKNNFADVRKLELINKRTLVTDGVLGITDKVIGGFTDDIEYSINKISESIRTKKQIEADYQQTLKIYKEENKKLVDCAEDILFTTFTKKIADKVTITPQYIEEKTEEINKSLWKVVKWYFEQRNKTKNDCYYIIDEKEKTITASNYKELPDLFYYWTGSRNKIYKSLKKYGMSKDFKPNSGKITLTSVIGRGIIHEITCADKGNLTLTENIEPCIIALYSIFIYKAKGIKKELISECNMLIGKTETGKLLTEEECKHILNIPAVECLEDEHKSAHWLKTSSSYHDMDRIIDINLFLEKQKNKSNEEQREKADYIKLIASRKKTAIQHEIKDLQSEITNVKNESSNNSNDRWGIVGINKKVNELSQELKRKQENQFFEEMQIDVDAENKINELFEDEKLKTEVIRQFIINIRGKEV